MNKLIRYFCFCIQNKTETDKLLKKKYDKYGAEGNRFILNKDL